MKNGKWPTSHSRGSSEILIWGPRKCGGGRGLVGVQLGEPRFRRVHAPGTLPDTPSAQAHVCTPSREGPCGWAPRSRSAGKGMHLWSFGVPHTVLPERSVLPHCPPGVCWASHCPQGWVSPRVAVAPLSPRLRSRVLTGEAGHVAHTDRVCCLLLALRVFVVCLL